MHLENYGFKKKAKVASQTSRTRKCYNDLTCALYHGIPSCFTCFFVVLGCLFGCFFIPFEEPNVKMKFFTSQVPMLMHIV